MPDLFDLAPPTLRIALYAIVAAVLAVAVYMAYDWAYDRGANAVRAEWQASDKRAADEARAKGDQLARDMHTVSEKKDAQIDALNGALSAALVRLSERAPRPAVPASASAACSGATGAQLYRQDGQFLAGEAARAERLRIELGACQESRRQIYEACGGKPQVTP